MKHPPNVIHSVCVVTRCTAGSTRAEVSLCHKVQAVVGGFFTQLRAIQQTIQVIATTSADGIAGPMYAQVAQVTLKTPFMYINKLNALADN